MQNNSCKNVPLFKLDFQNVRLYKSQIQLSKEINTFFISISVFFHGHWRLTGQQGKEWDHLLFYSTTSNRSQTFRHLVVLYFITSTRSQTFTH